MTGSPCVVFVHGWGFDETMWDPVRRLLPGARTETVDLGFFGSPRRPALPRGDVAVAVGHSFGFLWLLHQRPFPWRGLVSVAGFPRFTRAAGYPQGVANRVVAAMRKRFAVAPAATLRDFLERCGCGHDGAMAGAMDQAALGEGLRQLMEWDARAILDGEAAPLLALAAGDDAIVPPSLSRAVFAPRPGTSFHLRPDGGHCLPVSRAEWCAERISGFLESLETSRQRHLHRGDGRPDGGPIPAGRGPDPGPGSGPGPGRKAVIARSFDAAAAGYDSHAAVQRKVAGVLARRIGALGLAPRPRVLEVGCGTGLFSAALMKEMPDARCLFTDISPAMVGLCREKLGGETGPAGFAVMDGEAPAVTRGFDLVASSFAFQWFLDLPAAVAVLAHCLRPGGRLVFATLGQGTFAELRAGEAALGLPRRGLVLPTASELAGALAGALAGGDGPTLSGGIEEARFQRRYPHARAFLHEIRGLGADVPTLGEHPLSPGTARRLLRRLDGANGFTATYHVLFGAYEMLGEARPGSPAAVAGNGARRS